MMKLLLILYGILIAQGSIVPCANYIMLSKMKSLTTYYWTYSGDRQVKRSIKSNKESKTTNSITYYSQKQCCSGYSGSQCLPICSPSCGTNKECSSLNKCTCVNGWAGSNCNIPLCSQSCGTNKECSSPNKCTCINGWAGSNCDIPICSPSCRTNKECSSPNMCTCVNGWAGSNCNIPICSPSCGTNQECSSPNICECEDGWTGFKCKTPKCSPSCGTNKKCSSPNMCTCVSGWAGSKCNIPICSPSCGTNQECSSPNTCTCEDGWTGSNCKTPKCSPSCGTNKKCSSPNKCTCVNGWAGSNCDIPICSPSCGTNKECSSPNTCTCEDGWTGISCSIGAAICNSCNGINQQCLIPGVCTCVEGWTGPKCEIAICVQSCGTNMECSSPNTCTCVSGWKGPDCLTAICNPSCGINQECLSPNTCTCVEGWKGTNCLTDINECNEGTHDCEEGCENIKGSYICKCNDKTEILAYNKRNCLGRVNDASGIPGVNTVTLIWLPPTSYVNDREFSGYNITCSSSPNNETVIMIMFSNYRYTATSLDPFTQYKCCIEPHWTTNGVGPTVCIEQMTLEDEPGPVHHLAIDIISNTSANISWHPPVSLNGVIISYHIVIRNLTGNNSGYIMSDWILESSDRHYIIDNLEPFVPYEVDVVAETEVGKGRLVQKTFFTIQSVPFLAPSWSIVHRESVTEVQLQWTRLSLAASRGYITEYNIKYARSINSTCLFTENATHIQTQQEELMLTELNPKYEYCVSIAASTEMGIGIFSQWKLVKVFGKKITLYFLLEGVPKCTQWIQNNNLTALMKSFSNAIITQLRNSCQCHVTENYIQSILLLHCVGERSVVVKIILTLIKGYTGEEMFEIFNGWVNALPAINVDGLKISIESVCNSSDCLLATPSMIDTTKEPASSTLIPAVTVPIVVVIILIIIGIIIVISVTLRIKASRQYNCTNEQVANNGKDFPSTTSNPCYEARSVFFRNDTAIYDQPNLITSDHHKAKMNSNVAYGTAQSSLRSCHVTGIYSATTDVSAEDHIDDGVIETYYK